MHPVLSAILLLLCASSAWAGEIPFSTAAKISLVFRDDSDAGRQSYPHLLKVFLRLENVHDSEVPFVAELSQGIEAEVLDAYGKPFPSPGGMVSMMDGPQALVLPYGSILDWLISMDGGISMLGDTKNHYALIIGGRGWLIPVKTVGIYALRLRLRGWPWLSDRNRTEMHSRALMVDLPPTKIAITR